MEMISYADSLGKKNNVERACTNEEKGLWNSARLDMKSNF